MVKKVHWRGLYQHFVDMAIITCRLCFLFRLLPCYATPCHPYYFDHSPPFILVPSLGSSTHQLIFSGVASQLLRPVTESL
jgi:hypothetical protein